jgi:molybdopterin synthase catalytic subunit
MTPRIRIQTEDFDVAAELESLAVRAGDVGGVATFTGYVRADDGLTALILEHYPKMTGREIVRHAGEAAKRWPLLGITIIHRVGKLAPGEQIVFVAVAASHRRSAFEACEFLMDYLKVHAPFWKQEERGGATTWVEAKVTDDDAAERWKK